MADSKISRVTKVKDAGRHIGWRATHCEITQTFKTRREAECFERGEPEAVKQAPAIERPKRSWLSWLKRG